MTRVREGSSSCLKYCAYRTDTYKVQDFRRLSLLLVKYKYFEGVREEDSLVEHYRASEVPGAGMASVGWLVVMPGYLLVGKRCEVTYGQETMMTYLVAAGDTGVPGSVCLFLPMFMLLEVCTEMPWCHW